MCGAAGEEGMFACWSERHLDEASRVSLDEACLCRSLLHNLTRLLAGAGALRRRLQSNSALISFPIA